MGTKVVLLEIQRGNFAGIIGLGYFTHKESGFRIFVGEQLGPEYVVEALKEMEPNAVWIPEALELRAKSYAAVNHPLATRAQRDWEWYQRHQTVDDKK